MDVNYTTMDPPPPPQQLLQQLACCSSSPVSACCTTPPQYIIATPKMMWIDPGLPWWIYVVIACGLFLLLVIIILVAIVICCGGRRSCFWCCCFDDDGAVSASSSTVDIVDKDDTKTNRRRRFGGKRQQILYRYPDDDTSDIGGYVPRAHRLSSGRAARTVRVIDDIEDRPQRIGGTVSSRIARSTGRSGSGNRVVTEYIEPDNDEDLVYARRSGVSRPPMAVVTVGGQGSMLGGGSGVGYHSAALQVVGSGGVNYGSPWMSDSVPAIYPALR